MAGGPYLNQIVARNRKSLAMLGPDRWRLVIGTLLAAVSGLLETAFIFVIATTSLALAEGRPLAIRKLAFLGHHFRARESFALDALFVVVLLALSFPQASISASLSARAIVRWRTRVLHAYLNTTLRYRETHREAWLEQLVGEYCQKAESAVMNFMAMCVSGSTFLVMLVAAIVVSPAIGAAGVVLLIFGALLVGPVSRMTRRQTRTVSSWNREIVSESAQAARMSVEIVAFGVADRVERRLNAVIERSGKSLFAMRFEGRLVQSLYVYGSFAAALAYIAVLAFWVPRNASILAPLGILLVRALSYLRQLMTAAQASAEASTYMRLLDDELAVLGANQSPRSGIPCREIGKIRFDNVSYATSDGTAVLEGASLDIVPGEILAIAGASGSGKSTFCGLLLGLIQPASGFIRVDGVSQTEVSPQAWSALSAYVPQNCKIIAGTVSENIRFFREGIAQESVEEAARAAQIHADICELDRGYDTLIGPGWRGLSGGQLQRLALARALLLGPQLLVLDEPSSALDRLSEDAIAETLRDLRGKMTIVIASHSPVLLAVCDRIFYLRDGKLIQGR